jgi:hypothetical protein
MDGRLTNNLFLGLLIAVISSDACLATGWSGLRTSGSGTSGWQPMVCANGSGWQSCEMPVSVLLTASPPSIVANGQTSTITATVRDAYGVAVPNNVLNWGTTDGTLNASQVTTNASGQASVILKSSWTLGGASVTATTAENDGSSALWVPFIDSFVAYPSTYTGWANNGGVYSCSAWSPAASTVTSGTWFTQTATCYQNYYRYRQDRQQSIVTGAITNVGGQVTEYTTSTVGVSQGAIGTKSVGTCSYDVYNLESMAFFVTTDPAGGHMIVTTDSYVDYFYDGVTGVIVTSSNVHGTEIYTGYYDYRGFRYTSGRYMEYQFENGVPKYYFELCKTPL